MEAFITLTTDDKDIYYLNTRHIVGIQPHKKGSVVTTVVPVQVWGITQITVTDTPDEIISKITRNSAV